TILSRQRGGSDLAGLRCVQDWLLKPGSVAAYNQSHGTRCPDSSSTDLVPPNLLKHHLDARVILPSKTATTCDFPVRAVHHRRLGLLSVEYLHISGRMR